MNITRFDCWIVAWLDIFAGIVCVVSLGFYYPSWTFRYMAWCTEQNER